MRKSLTTAAVAATLLAAGCSSTTASSSTNAATPAATASTAAPAPAKTTVTAAQALTAISKTIPAISNPLQITDANDRNHLLGRPGEYTSKVMFTDTRIQASDVDGLNPDDVERGGGIEVFASAADAKARADYIQSVVKSMPMLLEYDYPHGNVLVRVSRFLPADQAAAYDKAAAVFG
jgi:ABC-type transport system substrate-binding protein